MKISLYISLLFLGVPAAASAQDWAVGTERERSTDMKVRTYCKAVKSAQGRPHPRPVGVIDSLGGGTPYLSISSYMGEFSSSISGKWGIDDGEWRDVGAKFWEEGLDYEDLATRDGRQIEVDIETWKYDAIKSGLADERGVID